MQRDILTERVAAGVAVLFSSHQLGVVADLCDQVVIVSNGVVVASGTTAELRYGLGVRRLIVHWLEDRSSLWSPEGVVIESSERKLIVELEADVVVDEIISALYKQGEVAEFSFEPPGLDEIFADLVKEKAAS